MTIMAKQRDDAWAEADGPDAVKIRRQMIIWYELLASQTRPSMRPAISKAMIDMVTREAPSSPDEREELAEALYTAADKVAAPKTDD